MTKRKIMDKAISLAMKINGGAVKRQGHGHPTAFIYYSGHINVLEIVIYENGWVESEYLDKSYYFNFHRDEEEELLRKLENLKEYAKELTRRRRRA